MNDQQTKYIAELKTLEQMAIRLMDTLLTAAVTMPAAAAELAGQIAGGLKINQMNDDQKFFYKKFNLRIRSFVALESAYSWTVDEIKLHRAMAPDSGENESENESEGE